MEPLREGMEDMTECVAEGRDRRYVCRPQLVTITSTKPIIRVLLCTTSDIGAVSRTALMSFRREGYEGR